MVALAVCHDGDISLYVCSVDPGIVFFTGCHGNDVGEDRQGGMAPCHQVLDEAVRY